jgi:hypothetical protein
MQVLYGIKLGGIMKRGAITEVLIGLVLLSLLLFAGGCGSNVTGEVKEKFSNKPIQNAKVQATSSDIAEGKKTEGKSVETDASGKFTIEDLSRKYNYRIKATKDGYFSLKESETSASLSGKEKTQILKEPLFLIKKNMVKGRVVDRFSQLPISGANVVARAKMKLVEFPSLAELRTSSNAQGVFDIGPFYPNSGYKIRIEKEGYGFFDFGFKNPGSLTEIKNETKLMKFPDEFGVYFVKQSNSYKFEKIEKFKAKLNKVDIKYWIGTSGYTTYNRYYIREREVQTSHIRNSGDKGYLALYFRKSILKQRKGQIIPLKFYERFPIELKGEKIDFLDEENVYLYANFEKSENLKDWEEINIKKLQPELFYSANSNAVIHLVPLSTLENGYYVFTLGHGPKWLFKIA